MLYVCIDALRVSLVGFMFVKCPSRSWFVILYILNKILDLLLFWGIGFVYEMGDFRMLYIVTHTLLLYLSRSLAVDNRGSFSDPGCEFLSFGLLLGKRHLVSNRSLVNRRRPFSVCRTDT